MSANSLESSEAKLHGLLGIGKEGQARPTEGLARHAERLDLDDVGRHFVYLGATAECGPITEITVRHSKNGTRVKVMDAAGDSHEFDGGDPVYLRPKNHKGMERYVKWALYLIRMNKP